MPQPKRTSRTKDTPLDNTGIRDVRRWRSKVVKKAGGTVEGMLKLLGESKPATKSKRTTSPKPKRAATKPTPKRRTRAA